MRYCELHRIKEPADFYTGSRVMAKIAQVNNIIQVHKDHDNKGKLTVHHLKSRKE